jgi:hypothetical protein
MRDIKLFNPTGMEMRTSLRIWFSKFFFVALNPFLAKAVWKCSYYATFRRLFWILGSHSRGYEDYCLLECDAYSSVEVDLRFGGTYCFHPQGRRVSQATSQEEAGSKQSCLLAIFLAYSTLRMEAVCFPETLNFYLTTPRHKPEDSSLRFEECLCLNHQGLICICTDSHVVLDVISLMMGTETVSETLDTNSVFIPLIHSRKRLCIYLPWKLQILCNTFPFPSIPARLLRSSTALHEIQF